METKSPIPLTISTAHLLHGKVVESVLGRPGGHCFIFTDGSRLDVRQDSNGDLRFLIYELTEQE